MSSSLTLTTVLCDMSSTSIFSTSYSIVVMPYPGDTPVLYIIPRHILTPEMEAILDRDCGGFPYFFFETDHIMRPNTPNTSLKQGEIELDLRTIEGVIETDNLTRPYTNVDKLWIYCL